MISYIHRTLALGISYTWRELLHLEGAPTLWDLLYSVTSVPYNQGLPSSYFWQPTISELLHSGPLILLAASYQLITSLLSN